MKKRSVFIDFRYLNYLTNGFGQLSLYYGTYFLENPEKYADLDITLLVPEFFVGKFGHHVNYLTYKKAYKFFPFLLPRFDIYHSITQQIKYTSLNSSAFRIVTVHDLNFLYEGEERKIRQRLERTNARISLADMITVISKFTESEIRTHLDIDNKPIVLNPLGLRDITHDLDKRPYFIQSNRKFFFTVAQVAEKKNFHVLLDMMKLMPEYDLYICGDDSSGYASMMKKRIEEEYLNNTFLTGVISHEEKVWMYKHCYAFLFPSKVEGFGMPVIDGMRFGKPVFSSRYTSLLEVGDKYAFFWDNFDPGYMRDVIVKNVDSFYDDTEFIRKQKEYAFSYTIERHMNTYFDLYRNANLNKKSSFKATFRNYINFIKA